MEPSYIQESQEIYNFAEPEYERYSYISNAVQRGVAVAKKRAPNVAYHINTEANIRDINTDIARAIFWDRQSFFLKIAIVFNDSRMQVLTMENGQYFQWFKGKNPDRAKE